MFSVQFAGLVAGVHAPGAAVIVYEPDEYSVGVTSMLVVEYSTEAV
jgi:hypothetical protein